MRAPTRHLPLLATITALAAGLGGCGGGDSQQSASSEKTRTETSAQPASAPSGWVTLRDAKTRFSVQAPRGYALEVHKGVYALRDGDRTITFSRAVTSATPGRYGGDLLGQVGGRVVSKEDGGDELTAAVAGSAGRETFLVKRAGDDLAVTTGRGGVEIDTLRRVGSSAKGGVALRARPAPAATLALKPYRSPDGGVTAQVPAGSEWNIDSGAGILGGSSPKGAFLLGRTYNVFPPENAPPDGNKTIPVAPYVDDPARAVASVLPQVNTSATDIRVRRVVRQGVLPSFSASGMYVFDYLLDGKPWTSVATVGVDAPDRYSNFLWSLYYSGIGVPRGGDPAVGAGLLKVWRSWNPSGAIAQRSQQTRQYLDSSNDVWQQTSEFRARTADRQARDVGCLLQGYSEIEDNSRKYDLPPLPCDQQYGGG